MMLTRTDQEMTMLSAFARRSTSLRVYSSVSQFDRGLNGRALVFGVHRLLNPLNIEPQPSSAALPASPNSPSIIEKAIHRATSAPHL
jgi:hypothetical protein